MIKEFKMWRLNNGHYIIREYKNEKIPHFIKLFNIPLFL